MKKKVNFFWIIYGVVLVILFLVSSTDLIIKEEEAEVYPISVIIRDTSDENYVNFRKGMERAALELNGDVGFITLYEKGNIQQQRELMLREQEDGSRALIVDLVEEEMLSEMRENGMLSIPVICINGEWKTAAGLNNTAVLTFDYYEMGCRLGEEILKDHPMAERVRLLEAEDFDTSGMLFSKGLCETLARTGCTVLPIELLYGNGTPEEMLRELAEGETGDIIIAASAPESLLAAAQLLSESEEAAKHVDGLYGRGNTVPILNYLDKGIIQGLCVTDDFSSGYLSVKTAVELAENRSVENITYFESYYIRREDLRNEKYEKMLYPIE